MFYAVFLDRWRRGRRSTPDSRAVARTTPTTAKVVYGGDLDGVAESLPDIARLGATAVTLTPVHVSESPHRYDGRDLLTVDPRLGGEAALDRLVRHAHRLGLKVVVDLAVTHVHQEHPAFQDLLRRQRASEHARWFRVRSFPVRAGDGKTYGHYYDRTELPWLDLEPGPAREHALEAALRLVRRGVDGLRLDAVSDAPASFWEELRRRVRAERPDALLLGEVVADCHARFAEERGLDMATDFHHREAMLEYFARGRMDAAEFWNRTEFAAHRLGPFDPCQRLLFLDNHDTARFLTVAKAPARVRLAIAYLMFRPEPVAITYGTEVDLCASGGQESTLDDAWPERLPMPETDAAALPPTAATLAAMARLRHGTLHDAADRVECVAARGHLLVLQRAAARGTVRAYFNAGEQPVDDIDLPPGATLIASVGESAAGAGNALPGLAARIARIP